MLTEPEAAGVHFGVTRGLTEGELLGVYDLGGGTFDAAVLRGRAAGVEILGVPEGMEHLGGVDFDEAVLDRVDQACGGAVSELDAHDSRARAAAARVRQDCVVAKETLSVDDRANVPVLLPTRQEEVTVTRDEFEAMIRPPLELDGGGAAPGAGVRGRRRGRAHRGAARRRVVPHPARRPPGRRGAGLPHRRRQPPQARGRPRRRRRRGPGVSGGRRPRGGPPRRCRREDPAHEPAAVPGRPTGHRRPEPHRRPLPRPRGRDPRAAPRPGGGPCGGAGPGAGAGARAEAGTGPWARGPRRPGCAAARTARRTGAAPGWRRQRLPPAPRRGRPRRPGPRWPRAPRPPSADARARSPCAPRSPCARTPCARTPCCPGPRPDSGPRPTPGPARPALPRPADPVRCPRGPRVPDRSPPTPRRW